MTNHPLQGINKMLRCMPKNRKDCCRQSWTAGREEAKAESKVEMEIKNQRIEELETALSGGLIGKLKFICKHRLSHYN